MGIYLKVEKTWVHKSEDPMMIGTKRRNLGKEDEVEEGFTFEAEEQCSDMTGVISELDELKKLVRSLSESVT